MSADLGRPYRQEPPGPPRSEDALRLPWDESAERAVLGAVLLDPAALDSALEILKPEDFHKPAHRLIFESFIALMSQSEAIDPITVRSELERAGALERAGGVSYVASLIDGLPRTKNVETYARNVHDRSLLRQILTISEALKSEASSGTRPAPELLDDIQGRLFRLSDAGRRSGFRPVQAIAESALKIIEDLSERRELVTGLSTGIHSLDRRTSGLQRGDLVILAARPSMGKTALAINLATHAALRGGASVGVFSLEMSAEQLLIRMIAGEGSIDSHKLRTGRLGPEEWERMLHTFDEINKSNIFIDDTPGISPMELRAKARRLKAEHDLGLIVVDYLQLMRLERRGENRQQEISEISRSLKAVAKELNVPVLALSQLSRAPDQRVGDHRPQLSDLRESGAIEQDADIVMFIFRPEVYVKDPEEVAQQDLEGKAEVILAKQRNGPTGTVRLFFVKEYTRFFEEHSAFGAGSGFGQ